MGKLSVNEQAYRDNFFLKNGFKKIKQTEYINLENWKVSRMNNYDECKWIAFYNNKPYYARNEYFTIISLINKKSKPTLVAEKFYKSVLKYNKEKR